jgi:ferredoxin
MLTVLATAQNRFPKPDFESGYKYPVFEYPVPDEALWNIVDVIALTAMMSIVAYSVMRARRRTPVFIISVISVLYFGFYRNGCVCSIGAIQNVALTLTHNSYAMPFAVFLIFILPVIFAFFFGRVFCAGVCPFGALQELVNVKNFRLPKSLSAVMGIFPWIYLFLALLYAVTRTQFIICRFDPFIGIFRFGGDFGMIIFGALFMVASAFTGRPFCRFLCPYGALLSFFSRFSIWKMNITTICVNCDLCRNACPVDAILPPYENRVRESRSKGNRRLLAYIVFLPVMMLVGTLTLRLISDTLSRSNRDVRLYELLVRHEANPQNTPSLDVETFLSQGGKTGELKTKADSIKAGFRTYSAIAGALIGLAVAVTLVNLAVRRTRKTYEISHAACVACGRCFGYCPGNNENVNTL